LEFLDMVGDLVCYAWWC